MCLQANTLGSWWAGLVQRHEQLQRWLTVGRPKCFWLTGFFNPQVHQRQKLVMTTLWAVDCQSRSLDHQPVTAVWITPPQSMLNPCSYAMGIASHLGTCASDHSLALNVACRAS